MAAHWQILAKGKGGKRPLAYANQISAHDWHALANQRWVAPAPTPPTYCQPTQHLVLRWQTETGLLKQSTVVCSLLDWSPAEVIAHYDDRGACETEIQADKQGLLLEQRRKKHLPAQEALVLLTDVAHNLVAWSTQWMFPTGRFAHFGPLRFTRDLLTLPGRLRFVDDHLAEVQLHDQHPYAIDVAHGLARLLQHFGNP